ncbi:MAG: 50S ribosomal protein L10 [Flammeovirgaceae bacterium]
MTREDKIELVNELSEKLSKTPFFYITDAGGMTVAETNAFRKACFEKGIEYKVVKNSLIKKALEKQKADYSELSNKALKGFSGIMFSPESSNLPAKVLIDFRKKTAKKDNPKPLLKGAAIESSVFIGDDQLQALSALKSKSELIGEIVGLLQSPAKNVISALKSSGGKIAGIVKTLSEKKGE